MKILFILLICLFSLLGFFVSRYIYQNKSKNKKIICPNKSKCDRVIFSSYSKIFGIGVEQIGMIYYVFIGLTYGFVYVFSLYNFGVKFILFGITISALLFSIYLMTIQVLIIEKICTWCLVSSIASFIIFVFAYFFTFAI